MNIEPSPGLLSTVTKPPWFFAIRRRPRDPSLSLALCFSGEEGLEYPPSHLGRHPRPRISDCQLQVAAELNVRFVDLAPNGG